MNNALFVGWIVGLGCAFIFLFMWAGSQYPEGKGVFLVAILISICLFLICRTGEWLYDLGKKESDES